MATIFWKAPPRQGFTSLIWIMPVLMLLAGVAAVVALAREWQRQARVAGVTLSGEDDPAEQVALSSDERQALTALLRREVAADEGLPLAGREDG